MKTSRFEHRFVDHFPEQLESGVLYVSMSFASVAHACACGCGQEVVTPLSPVGWRMMFDGVGISLYPSIGNGSFPCRSHYWIKRSEVEWSYDMSDAEIEESRKRSNSAMDGYFHQPSHTSPSKPAAEEPVQPHRTIWSRLRSWINPKS